MPTDNVLNRLRRIRFAGENLRPRRNKKEGDTSPRPLSALVGRTFLSDRFEQARIPVLPVTVFKSSSPTSAQPGRFDLPRLRSITAGRPL